MLRADLNPEARGPGAAGRESLAGAFVEAGAEAAPRADVAERRRVIQFFKERTGA